MGYRVAKRKAIIVIEFFLFYNLLKKKNEKEKSKFLNKRKVIY